MQIKLWTDKLIGIVISLSFIGIYRNGEGNLVFCAEII